MAHTPGPWKLSKSTNYYSITDEQGNYIAPRLYINDEPNAKLMTAAPELLALLKELYARRTSVLNAHAKDGFSNRDLVEQFEAIRDAINKAT